MSNFACANSTDFFVPSSQQIPSIPVLTGSYFTSQDQAILKGFYDQIDPQNSGQIYHKDLAERIATLGIKFHDKRSLYTFRNYPNFQSQTLTFADFIALVKDLRLSQVDLWKMKNTLHNFESPWILNNSHSKCQQVSKEHQNYHFHVKRQMLQNAFSELINKQDKKLNVNYLKQLMESTGYSWEEEKISKLFNELDLYSKGEITSDDVVESCKTKKGDLSAYNLLIIVEKLVGREKDTLSQLVCLDNFNPREESVLDLFEAYQLFDVEAQGMIKPETIKNQLDVVPNQINEKEQEALAELTRSHSHQISFQQFFNQFKDQSSNINALMSLAVKFNNVWYQSKDLRFGKGKDISTHVLNEDKSSLYSTIDSLQSFPGGTYARGSLEEVLDPSFKKKQISILSDPDIENNQQSNKNKNFANESSRKISSIQDRLDSLDIKGSINLDLKAAPRSSVTDSTSEITPELKSSQKSLIDAKLKDSINMACSLESLVEDGESADATPMNQDFEENEYVKNENLKMRRYIQEKESELAALRENHSSVKADLEDNLAVKTSLIARMHKEQEAIKAHLDLAKEEVEQLKIKMNDSAMKLKKANDETTAMKKKLAVKVKEALIQKEKYDAIERQYNDKTREVDCLVKKKTLDEKAYQENIAGMKTKLAYLTQKFTEYLTQNTSLQSELHEKNTAVKKIDTAFKDHIRKTEDQKQKLDLRICELEEQMRSKSKSTCEKVEKETETDASCSPLVSKRQMEEKLSHAINQNQDLQEICNTFQKETGRLKHELQQKNQEVQRLNNVNQKYDQEPLKNNLNPNDIAHTLIESLYAQLETIKKEKETLEIRLGAANNEIENERAKNIVLTNKVNEYQLEFNYLNECLNESLLKNNGSNDSVILLGHEKNEGQFEKNNQDAGNNEMIEKVSSNDPRENLKSVQAYVGKLETLDQRTKRLDEEIEMMNKKIETISSQNNHEDQESGDRKCILVVYKKLIENKQLEIENLKKRVKGKAGLVSANMRLLSKLEALFTEKLNELSEVSQNQEKLIVDNNRLNLIIREQSAEIERLRREDNHEGKKTQRKTSDVHMRSEMLPEKYNEGSQDKKQN